MVGDHSQRRVASIGVAGMARRRLEQILEEVDLVVGVHPLHHRGDALQPHAGIDGGLGQRVEHPLLIAVILHKDQIPDL